MKVIVCLDDDGGMLFNKRRQSKDRELINNISELIDGNRLLVNKFSEKLLEESDILPIVNDDFLQQAGERDFCLVENCSLREHLHKITEVIVYKWNRKYPADFKFDINLSEEGFLLKEAVDFKGFSHEKITREIYTK